MKEDVHIKLVSYTVDCPNCRAVMIMGSRDDQKMYGMEGVGVQVACHNCHADYVIEKITYNLRRVI